jgi:hypothetical protein
MLGYSLDVKYYSGSSGTRGSPSVQPGALKMPSMIDLILPMPTAGPAWHRWWWAPPEWEGDGPWVDGHEDTQTAPSDFLCVCFHRGPDCGHRAG